MPGDEANHFLASYLRTRAAYLHRDFVVALWVAAGHRVMLPLIGSSSRPDRWVVMGTQTFPEIR